MKLDWFVKLVLSMIVVLLGTLVLRPLFQSAPVEAQSVDGRSFYVEPGYAMLRKPDGSGQMYGKLMIDMRTGDIGDSPRLSKAHIRLMPAKASRLIPDPYTSANLC